MNDDDLELAGAVADGLAPMRNASESRRDAGSRRWWPGAPPCRQRCAMCPRPNAPGGRAGRGHGGPRRKAPDERGRCDAAAGQRGVARHAGGGCDWSAPRSAPRAAVVVLAIGGVVVLNRSDDDSASEAPSAARRHDRGMPVAPTTIAPATTVATLAAPLRRRRWRPPAPRRWRPPWPRRPPTTPRRARRFPRPEALPRTGEHERLRAAAAAMTPAPPDVDDALGQCADGSLAADAVYVIDGVDTPSPSSPCPPRRIGAVDVERCVILVSAPR